MQKQVYFDYFYGEESEQFSYYRIPRLLAELDNKINSEAEDTVAAVLEFESGALGVLQATTSVYPGFNRRLEICGSEGTAIIQEDSIVYCAFKDPEKALVCSQSHHDTGSRPDGMDHTLHKKQISDFLESVAEGRKPFLDARDGKMAVEIIEAIYTSAKTGKKIYLSANS